MYVSAIIQRDLDVVLVYDLAQNCWALPYQYIDDKSDPIESIVNYCKKYDLSIKVVDLFLEAEKDGKKTICFKTSLESYTTALGRDNAKWISLSNIESLTFAPEQCSILQKLSNDYKQHQCINKQLESNFLRVATEMNAEVITQLSLDAVSIFVKNEYGGYCPFIFRITHYIDEKTSNIDYSMSWPITRMFCSGDKSDLYVLFSSLMAALQKALFSENIFVEYLSLFDNCELNGARLIFKPSNKMLSLNAFIETATKHFQHFLASLLFFEICIGSFSLIRKDELSQSEFSVFLDDNESFNSVAREEHQFYANFKSAIFALHIQNNIFSYKKLTSLQTWSLIDGIDGKILRQENSHGLSYNFIDNNVWEQVSTLINTRGFTEYYIICQYNCLYVVTPDQLWIFHGDFGEFRVNEERTKIQNRQVRENSFLHFRRQFKWKYPINPGRFEELIADLIETDPTVDRVRLAGSVNNPDFGRDLLIYKQRMTQPDGGSNTDLFIGQCKAYQNTVNKSHVNDIRDTIEYFSASGFFLAVASKVSGPLINHLEKLRGAYEVEWWTEREIFKKLRQNPNIANEYTDILDILEE